MLLRKRPDGIHVTFDDHCLVAQCRLLLPATLALRVNLLLSSDSVPLIEKRICPLG